MSDEEIQFGDVEEVRPRSAVRPDTDAHYAVSEVGIVKENTLPIFVDLDVLRDMEAHALTNTDVELGGVMLGGQFEDADGNPFVLVTDSLRAEHYEATKGSFKFTHETWTTISRKRDEFAADMEMVGWYHTHPDWGVFLSGMDLFICENFFRRPLDVALVIDPCRQDRGWFQWTSVESQSIEPTGGFYLFTSRFRTDELEYFADLYHGPSNPRKDKARSDDQRHLFQGITGMADPRYSSFGAPSASPIVNLVDQRQPPNTALWAILAAQFLVILYLGFQLSRVQSESTKENDLETQVGAMAAVLDQVNLETAARNENSAYRSMMTFIAAQNPDQKQLLERMAQVEIENAKLNEDLNAQRTLATRKIEDLSVTSKKLELTESRYENEKKRASKLDKQVKDYERKEKEKEKDTEEATNWPLIFSMIGGGVLLLFGGAVAGYAYARNQFDGDWDERDPDPPRASLADIARPDEPGPPTEEKDDESINFNT